MKFQGSASDLEAIIQGMGHTIKSSTDTRIMHQIKTTDGIILNLYKTGTLQFQGNPNQRKRFEADFNHYNDTGESFQATAPQPQDGKTDTKNAPSSFQKEKCKEVFVVYGHDGISKEQLELVLYKLGLKPFVLANNGGQGLTIIEALESKIGKNSQKVSFGIVLMTPDDKGYAISAGENRIQYRARQNVILEMGMLISSIGRKNMALLVKGDLEKPSDTDGILHIPFNNHVKETVPKLTNRLTDSGFTLTPDQITRASS